MKQTDIITANHVTAGYKSKITWEDATFSVQPGEFIGLLGPNGAGKTTLLRLLLGLMQPLRGELHVLGEKPQKGNRRISYIPQKRFVDSETRLEALEYVRLGLTSDRWGFSLPAKTRTERHQALEAMKLVDAEALAHQPLNELSGGELQRVFLAQALVGNPELLLLDEPLANLDIRRETQLIQLVHQVAKQQNIAVLLIAHDINPLLPVVDRIIYIANGRVATGTPDEIITTKTLSALYDAPIEVLRSPAGRMAVLGVEEAVHHNA